MKYDKSEVGESMTLAQYKKQKLKTNVINFFKTIFNYKNNLRTLEIRLKLSKKREKRLQNAIKMLCDFLTKGE